MPSNMATPRRQKEALRAALFAFVAGGHYITELVEKAQSISPRGTSAEAIEARQVMLEADYERFLESTQSVESLIDIMDEEGLYPFGSEWPREAFEVLFSKLIAPKLTLSGSEEALDTKFKFKKGFKDLLNGLASELESSARESSTLDHWMVLIFNTAFHAGVITAARNAENTKIYYEVISEIEEETEPWGKYTQLADILDRQLRRETRRRTGLVSDLDY